MIDSRSEGVAYHRVYVNGVEFSKHTTHYKAAEKAYDVALLALLQKLDPFPAIYVDTDQRVHYEPAPGFDLTAPLPEPPKVTSDGGEDLIDFLERIQGQGTIGDVLPAASSVWEAADAFAEQTKGTWLIRRLYADNGDGTRTLLAYGWRGFVLTVHARDRGAIRIGGAS